MTKGMQKLYTTNNQCSRRKHILCRITRTGILFSALIFVFLLASSCMDIKMRIGERPDSDIMEKKLRIGESTRNEVIAALGEPDGKGKAMLPIDSESKVLWSYYYEEGDLKDARRIFLFVFFDQDSYDGYMWFSSLPK
jgi:hypothetical protein